MLKSKFVKFLMSVLKWQVNSSLNFALFFTAMTHNCSVNFNMIPFLLWTKGSYQNRNFDTFKCSGENFPNFLCHLSNHKSVFVQNLHNSSVSWKIYTLVTRSQLKYNFLRVFGSKVPHVNSKLTSQFLFNFCVILHCHDK